MSDFGKKLQEYASGTDKCLHPIKDVVELADGEFCQACNTFLKAKPKAQAPVAKDARIAALRKALEAIRNLGAEYPDEDTSGDMFNVAFDALVVDDGGAS